MAKLTPYLNFPGTAREAMQFYADIFGGNLTASTFADFGAVPADHEHANGIMHSQLIGDIVTLMGADELPGMSPEVQYGDSMSLAFSGPEQELFEGWFAQLADGGEVITPIERQVWGDLYGSVKDQFGVTWMFNVESGEDAYGEQTS